MRFFKLLLPVVVLTLIVLIFSANTLSKESAENNPLEQNHEAIWQEAPLLAASSKGIFHIDEQGRTEHVFSEGSVRTIIKQNSVYYAYGEAGILFSTDGKVWEERNSGLPVKTIKEFTDGLVSFHTIAQEIKDLTVDPSNEGTLICATKEMVFLSEDFGKNWKSIGFPARTNGIKAVAIYHQEEKTFVLAAHAIYGIHQLELGRSGAKWEELNEGLKKLQTTKNPDEVSDILVDSEGRIFASQSFTGAVYQLNKDTKQFQAIYSQDKEFASADGLSCVSTALTFSIQNAIVQLSLENKSASIRSDLHDLTLRVSEAIQAPVNALTQTKGSLKLEELWLLEQTYSANAEAAERREKAANKEGLYIPAHHALDEKRMQSIMDTIDRSGLNMIVIDMKDDYGRLRWDVQDSSIKEKGRVFSPIQLDDFVAKMKERGIWLVARIVVFKDKELYSYNKNKYAVMDSTTNTPWRGYRMITKTNTDENGVETTEKVRNYYDEYWVDPYSQDVWDYTAAISRELARRGFDELQYDYIRFPTDGLNLSKAQYRWKSPGMDMESAIISFLHHIRKSVDAPISLDIYGANGWYRTGARTGQEVELLSHYADIICPMYYPSHFEQDFLAQDPAVLRPWRIYYNGTLRTETIARKQVLVRSWAQSFYLNVAYDRVWYNKEYVRLQVKATREAGNGGIAYWNNIGRYDEIPDRIAELASQE